MSVKINFHIYCVFFSFFLFFLSFFFSDFTLGKIWFYLDGNSLVGFHAFLESISNTYQKGIFLLKGIIFLLDLNIFLVFGINLIFISYFVYILNY